MNPQTVLFYNSSKVGVEWLSNKWSTRSATRWWTVTVWCSCILDKACINALVVYKQISEESITLFIFILTEEILETVSAINNRITFRPISRLQQGTSHSSSPSVILKKSARCESQSCTNLGSIHCSRCSKVKGGKCLY